MGLKDGLRKLLGAALLLACQLAAAAWEPLPVWLAPEQQPVPLLDAGAVWIDPTGQARVDEVAADPAIDWQPTRADAIHPLAAGRALWIRFTVPPLPDAERWYLEIPYASVNRATLYARDSLGRWSPASAGDTLAVADWPVPHRHPVLPLTISSEQPQQHLLRVENPFAFGVPLSFVSESRLSLYEQRTSLVLGIYFGLAGLAATLAVLSAISLRDTAYGLYALSVALMGLAQAAMTGIGGLHLWPRSPVWNDMSPLVLPVLAVGALLWFFSVVVALPQRAPRVHRLLLALAALALPLAAVIAAAPPALRFALMGPYIVASATVATGAVLWAASRGDRWASLLLASSLPVLVGGALPLLRTAGWIPVSFWTQHGMQVGLALELPLMLVILMLRSQQRREHSRRIQGLERIDPATGLINEAVFVERLVRLIARSQRLKMRSAVLLLHIANVEQIRRQFDHRAAEELPLRVAGRLLSAARPIDSVARLSDGRFGMLLEGPLTAEEVAAAGPRVVARCLMPFRNKPIEWVAQVRVAQGLVPQDGDEAGALLARLQALLDAVPEGSRRAVFQLGRADPIS
jgi:GGDEF domain-containing protein